ncbi:MAG: NYN domain-containing protein [Acidobacteriota bacterium]|nr:NYN domain-containing protein [Acidobacteriota bacterium]
MNPLRTVIFIDGQNFKYNLGAFRFQGQGGQIESRPYRLDEKHFLWREFFKGIIDKYNQSTGWEHRLVRVYWYNAERMRPFEINEPAITKVLRDYPHLQGLTRDTLVDLAKKWYEEQRRYFDQTRDRVFEGIQRKERFLEFKYVGDYVLKPFEPYKLEQDNRGKFYYQGIREGEKGVDVGIAVDMISKLSDYDVAVLVSGDADFLPAVQYIKDRGTIKKCGNS